MFCEQVCNLTPSYSRPVLLLHPPERVVGLAGAVSVTEESVQARGAEAVLAARALEALVAQTGPVDVVALGAVLTVTLVGALRPVGAHRAFVLAPGQEERKCCLNLKLTAVNII